MSGTDHPATLIVRANLAAVTGLAGDAAGAWDQFAALLPIFEQSWAPRTRRIRAKLSHWTEKAGGGTEPSVN